MPITVILERCVNILQIMQQRMFFVDFYLHVERLVSVTREETAGMFNSKNSFLWFVLFNKFDKLSERYRLEDKRFYEFLCALQADLHSKKINGISFDSLDEETGTKKRSLLS